jgi:hypothetical protein
LGCAVTESELRPAGLGSTRAAVGGKASGRQENQTASMIALRAG